MRDERYFSSQSQKFNFTQNKLEKSVITINDNKETFNAQNELASNDKETININEKTIKDDIQTNINKNNCNEETVTNLTIIIPFYTLMLIIKKLLQKTYSNTKIRITIMKKNRRAKKVKMHHQMKRKHLKRSPRKIKTHQQNVKGYI